MYGLFYIYVGSKSQIATHILQLVFLGDYGFRFPIAYFATTEAVAAELHIIVWEAIHQLKRRGFTVKYIFHFECFSIIKSPYSVYVCAQTSDRRQEMRINKHLRFY